MIGGGDGGGGADRSVGGDGGGDALATANAAVCVGGGRRTELTDRADGAGGELITVSLVAVVESQKVCQKERLQAQ